MDWGSAGQRRLKADTPISLCTRSGNWFHGGHDVRRHCVAVIEAPPAQGGMQVMISKDPSSVLVGVAPIR